MRPKLTLLTIAIISIAFYSCKKDSNTSIAGKWSIVKTAYHQAHDTTINGTAADYYNFGPENTLSIQDHQNIYTGKYNLNGTKSVDITIYTVDGHGMGVITPPSVYTILYEDNNNITLTSPANPFGQEVVYLKR